MKRFRIGIFSIAIASLGALAPAALAQSIADAGFSSSNVVSPLPSTPQPQLDLIYKRPTEKQKFHSYLFDAFGPYAIAGAAVTGALDQANNAPHEWGQGWGAYGERVGSNFGIAMVTTTTRYALAEAFHEDTIYYRCGCKGVLPRLRHAAISTVTARYGEDGRRRASVAAIVAPFAGSMTAIYGWYPDRFGAGDGLRMGSYAVLGSFGGNVASEFLYGGPHTLFLRGARSASPTTETVASSTP